MVLFAGLISGVNVDTTGKAEKASPSRPSLFKPADRVNVFNLPTDLHALLDDHQVDWLVL